MHIAGSLVPFIQPPPPMSSAASNLDRIRALYHAFGQGDIPTVLGMMHPDIVWREAEGFPYGGTYHGPEAVLEHVFKKLGTEWEGFRATPSEFIDGGEAVVVLGTYTGTYRASGGALEVPFAHVWKLRDGRVTAFTQYTDTLLVHRAMQAA